jgi:hypothetical protein
VHPTHSDDKLVQKQVSQAPAVQALNFVKVFDDIDEEKQWNPTITTVFLSTLNLSTFHEPSAHRGIFTPAMFLPTPFQTRLQWKEPTIGT